MTDERRERMARGITALVLLVAVCSCSWAPGSSRYGGYSPGTPRVSATAPEPPRLTPVESGPPPSGCAPAGTDWERAQVLYASTEASVHELVTCGGAQIRVAQSVLAIVLSSNRTLFDGPDYTRLVDEARRFGLDLSMPFVALGDGHWRMPIGRNPGAHFDLAFFRPTPACDDTMHSGDPACAPIREDPFAIDSYLGGLVITSSLTVAEMLDDPSRRTVLTFDWDTRGPLADLLGGGAPFADPFDVRVGLEDVVTLALGGMVEEGPAGADFGPLRTLLDTGMQSCAELVDVRGAAVVEYHVDARRETVAALAARGELGWEVERLEADDGTVHFSGGAASLGFVRVGMLTGAIEYDVTTPTSALVARSDFGAGAAYPSTSWSCRE